MWLPFHSDQMLRSCGCAYHSTLTGGFKLWLWLPCDTDKMSQAVAVTNIWWEVTSCSLNYHVTLTRCYKLWLWLLCDINKALLLLLRRCYKLWLGYHSTVTRSYMLWLPCDTDKKLQAVAVAMWHWQDVTSSEKVLQAVTATTMWYWQTVTSCGCDYHDTGKMLHAVAVNTIRHWQGVQAVAVTTTW